MKKLFTGVVVILVAASFALLQLGRSETDINSNIPNYYCMPFWFEKSFNFNQVEDIKDIAPGSEFKVVASLTPTLADMINLNVSFLTSEGLVIVDGESSWHGDIKRGESREFWATVRRTGEHEIVERLRFFIECDFPRQVLIDYVKDHQDSEYKDPSLRSDLSQFIEKHPDRQNDSSKLIIQ